MRILFVHIGQRSFQATDLRLLRERNEVRAIDFRWKRETLRSIRDGVRWCDLVFGWFASHHTFLPAVLANLTGKPVLIAASDYDLKENDWIGLKRFGEAATRGRIRKIISNRVLAKADIVLVPSQFSASLALQNTTLRQKPEKLRIVPHGFDVPPPVELRRETIVTTIGDLLPDNWIRKGHREFAAVAARLPHIPFFLVGKASPDGFLDYVRSVAPPNLILTGYIDEDEKAKLLARTAVYAQLSWREGFGCSVAEAMLAACVPVVTQSSALPEVVGDCGYYTKYGDLDGIAAAISVALNDSLLGHRARDRIASLFSIDRRRQALNNIISDLSDRAERFG